MLQIFSAYAGNIKNEAGTESQLFWKEGLVIEKNNQLLLIKFNRKNQCIDLYADMQGNNFSLQMEIVEFYYYSSHTILKDK